MSLSTTYTKTETDFLIQQLEKKTASGYKGDLTKTDPAPTTVGFYGLTEVGIYPNLGNINAEEGKLNFASFDGTTWKLIAVEVPKGEDGKTIEPWTAKVYVAGSSVYYNNKIYNTSSATLATDVPGIATTWVEQLSSKLDKFVATFAPKGYEFTGDIVKSNNCNAPIKALYLLNKPTGTNIVYINYFAKAGSTFQIGLNTFDTANSTETTLADTTSLTYEFDKVVPIYNNSSKTTIVGYIYVSLADYVTIVNNVGEGGTRMPRCSEGTYSYLNQPLINNYFLEQKIGDLENLGYLQKMHPNSITFWGDSITWGSASSTVDNCYTAIFRNLLMTNGYKEQVINCGVGGENFENILVRQGAIGFYLGNDITIPQSTTESVTIMTTNNYIHNGNFKNTYYGENSYFTLLAQGEVGRDSTAFPTVNPIIVKGVECIMTYTGNTQNATITLKPKANLTAPIIVKAGTYLFPSGSRFKYKTAVFAIGTNGGFLGQSGETLTEQQKIDRYIELVDLAIRKANTSQFIVCSPYGGTALTNLGVNGLINLEKALSKKYGSQFFNWRKYLNEEGLADAGITPTSQDNTDIAAGKVPTSLLSDGLHPNDAGHLILGQKFYQIFLSLGYLTK